MTLSLREPKLLGALISVDNAPIITPLEGTFSRYIQGMRDIEKLNITKRGEADQIMSLYEKVRDRAMGNRES
jgi:hypothetical protein